MVANPLYDANNPFANFNWTGPEGRRLESAADQQEITTDDYFSTDFQNNQLNG